MPHQCVRCNIFYEDGSKELLKGCTCGGKLFFFIKQKKLDEHKKEIDLNLTDNDKVQIEKDIYDMIGVESSDAPVILDMESIRVVKPGKYEVDLVHLFKGEPLVFKLSDGKYIIDIAETFRRLKK